MRTCVNCGSTGFYTQDGLEHCAACHVFTGGREIEHVFDDLHSAQLRASVAKPKPTGLKETTTSVASAVLNCKRYVRGAAGLYMDLLVLTTAFRAFDVLLNEQTAVLAAAYPAVREKLPAYTRRTTRLFVDYKRLMLRLFFRNKIGMIPYFIVELAEHLKEQMSDPYRVERAFERARLEKITTTVAARPTKRAQAAASTRTTSTSSSSSTTSKEPVADDLIRYLSNKDRIRIMRAKEDGLLGSTTMDTLQTNTLRLSQPALELYGEMDACFMDLLYNKAGLAPAPMDYQYIHQQRRRHQKRLFWQSAPEVSKRRTQRAVLKKSPQHLGAAPTGPAPSGEITPRIESFIRYPMIQHTLYIHMHVLQHLAIPVAMYDLFLLARDGRLPYHHISKTLEPHEAFVFSDTHDPTRASSGELYRFSFASRLRLKVYCKLSDDQMPRLSWLYTNYALYSRFHKYLVRPFNATCFVERLVRDLNFPLVFVELVNMILPVLSYARTRQYTWQFLLPHGNKMLADKLYSPTTDHHPSLIICAVFCIAVRLHANDLLTRHLSRLFFLTKHPEVSDLLPPIIDAMPVCADVRAQESVWRESVFFLSDWVDWHRAKVIEHNVCPQKAYLGPNACGPACIGQSFDRVLRLHERHFTHLSKYPVDSRARFIEAAEKRDYTQMADFLKTMRGVRLAKNPHAAALKHPHPQAPAPASAQPSGFRISTTDDDGFQASTLLPANEPAALDARTAWYSAVRESSIKFHRRQSTPDMEWPRPHTPPLARVASRLLDYDYNTYLGLERTYTMHHIAFPELARRRLASADFSRPPAETRRAANVFAPIFNPSAPHGPARDFSHDYIVDYDPLLPKILKRGPNARAGQDPDLVVEPDPILLHEALTRARFRTVILGKKYIEHASLPKIADAYQNDDYAYLLFELCNHFGFELRTFQSVTVPIMKEIFPLMKVYERFIPAGELSSKNGTDPL